MPTPWPTCSAPISGISGIVEAGTPSGDVRLADEYMPARPPSQIRQRATANSLQLLAIKRVSRIVYQFQK